MSWSYNIFYAVEFPWDSTGYGFELMKAWAVFLVSITSLLILLRDVLISLSAIIEICSDNANLAQ